MKKKCVKEEKEFLKKEKKSEKISKDPEIRFPVRQNHPPDFSHGYHHCRRCYP